MSIVCHNFLRVGHFFGAEPNNNKKEPMTFPLPKSYKPWKLTTGAIRKFHVPTIGFQVPVAWQFQGGQPQQPVDPMEFM